MALHLMGMAEVLLCPLPLFHLCPEPFVGLGELGAVRSRTRCSRAPWALLQRFFRPPAVGDVAGPRGRILPCCPLCRIWGSYSPRSPLPGAPRGLPRRAAPPSFMVREWGQNSGGPVEAVDGPVTGQPDAPVSGYAKALRHGRIHPDNPVIFVKDGNQIRHTGEGALPFLLGPRKVLLGPASSRLCRGGTICGPLGFSFHPGWGTKSLRRGSAAA